MTEACVGRIENLKILEYVCVTSQTHYAQATGAQQRFNACLTHAWGMLLQLYLIKSKCACSVHWRASNVRQMRWKCIQGACNACGTYSIRIRHTLGTCRVSRKFSSMFKKFLSPNAPGARSDLQRRISTCTKRTPSVQKARVMRF